MLCKKCNTAINEDDLSCAYCGAKVDKNKIKKTTASLFILVLIVMFTFTYIVGRNISAPDETEQPKSAEETPPPAEPVKTIIPDETVLTEDTPIEEPELTIEEIYDMLNDAAAAAKEFYDKFSTYAVYVTNKGYLFEYMSDAYITTRDFEVITDIKPENINSGILVLYLKTSDLTEYPKMAVKESNELVIFTAYETKDGFILSSVNNGGGILPREDLQCVLSNYINTHGQIRKILKGSDDYNQISMLVGNMYDGRDSFDFRYLYRDDKYCVAVTSPKDNSIEINEHVLYNENDTWYIGLLNYEVYEKYKAVINSQFVDINLDLVPNYNMTAFSKSLRSDYSEVIRAMKLNSLISEEDEPITFQSGTDDFCYLESSSGRMFVGNLNKDGMWEVREVSSYEQGVERINGLTNKPPLFILKQY